MSELSFNLHANYHEIFRLQDEIRRLENQIKNFSPGGSRLALSSLESQLNSTRSRMNSLADATARAGAQMELNIRQGVNNSIGALNDLQGVLSNPIVGFTQIAGVAALGGFLSKVAQVRGEFQQMQASIDTLLGSAAKGKKLMSEITDLAATSPLDFKGTTSAAQQMLGFGIAEDKVIPYLKAIGDVSMGDAQRFRSLVLAFSQMSAAGKLMGQDLNQMVNAGFQPLQVMAEKTGKSIGQLKKEMSDGKITAEMVQQAFIDATSEGGKFYMMSENANNTITGQMAKLGDEFDLMYNDLGKGAEGVIMKAIEGASWLVSHYKEIGSVLLTAIATFGVYKTSVMASEFALKAAATERTSAVVKGYEEELAKFRELEAERRKSAVDNDLQDAVTGGGITQDKAEQIQSLRDEMAERVKAAQTDRDSAEISVKSAQKRIDEAQREIDQAQDWLDTCEQIGDAEDVKKAKQELTIAEKKKDIATTDLQTASDSANAAQTRLGTLADQQQAIAEIQKRNATNSANIAVGANTAIMKKNIVAQALSTAGAKAWAAIKGVGIGLTKSLTGAMNGLNAAMKANPIGMLITGFTMLYGLWQTFSSDTDEATASEKEFGKSTMEEVNNLERLYAILGATSKESKVHKDALEELKQIASDHGMEALDSEEKLIAAKQRLIELIKEEGRQRILASQIESISDEQIAESKKLEEAIMKEIEGESSGISSGQARDISRMMSNAIAESKEQLQALWAQYKEGNASALSEIYSILKESAWDYTESLGISSGFKFDAEDIMKSAIAALNRMDELSASASELTKRAEVNANRLKEITPVKVMDLNNMSIQDLFKNLDKVKSKALEVSSTTIAPKTDSSGISTLNATMSNTQSNARNINSTPVSPNSNLAGIAPLVNASESLETQLTRIGAKTIAPKADPSNFFTVQAAIAGVKRGVRNLNNITARPQVDAGAVFAARAAVDGLTNKLDSDIPQPRQIYLNCSSVVAANTAANATETVLKILSSRRSELRVDYAQLDAANAGLDRAINRYNVLSALPPINIGVNVSGNDNKEAVTEDDIKQVISYRIVAASVASEIDELYKLIKEQQDKAKQGSKDWWYWESQRKTLESRDLRKHKDDYQKRQQMEFERKKAGWEKEKRRLKQEREERRRQEELNIEAMEEGPARERRQIKLDTERKVDALDDAAQAEADALEKNAVRAWQNQGLKADGTQRTEADYYGRYREEELARMRAEWLAQAKTNIGYDTQLAIIRQKNTNSITKEERKRLEAMWNFLQEYGNFQQKLEAMEEQHNAKVAQLTASQDWENLKSEMMQYESKRREVLSQQLNNDLGWETIYAGVEGYAEEFLITIRKRLQSLLEDSSVEIQLKDRDRILDKIADINKALTVKTDDKSLLNTLTKGGGLWSILEHNQNQIRLQADVDSAQARFEEARTLHGLKQMEVNRAQFELEKFDASGVIDEGKRAGLVANLSQAQADATAAGNSMNGAQVGVQNTKGALAGAGGAASSVALVDTIVHGVNDNLQSMGQLLGELQLEDTGFAKGMESFAESSQYATAAFDSLKKGDFVGVISNALGAFRTLGDALGKWGIGFMGGSDNTLHEDMVKLAATNKELEEAIRLLSEDLSKGSMTDKFKTANKMMESLEQQKNNDRSILQRAGNSFSHGFLGIGGRNSVNKKIDDKMTGADWVAISRAVGKDIRHAYQLFQLSPEELAEIRKYATAQYDNIKRAAEEGYAAKGEGVDIGAYLDAMSEYGEKTEEMLAQIREAFTNTSFDGVLDEFRSMLTDMQSSTADFTNKFEEMMRSAVINALVQNLFSDRLKKWYESFAEVMKDGGGEMTRAQMENLKQEYRSIVDDGMRQRDKLMDMLDLDGSTTQQSSSSSIAQMSQDTGDAIDGRLTAMQIAMESVRGNNELQTASLASINNEVLRMALECSRLNQHHDNIESKLGKVHIELQTISEHTGAMVRPIQEMQLDIAQIKRNTAKL